METRKEQKKRMSDNKRSGVLGECSRRWCVHWGVAGHVNGLWRVKQWIISISIWPNYFALHASTRNQVSCNQSDYEVLFVEWESRVRSDDREVSLNFEDSDQPISKEDWDHLKDIKSVRRKQRQGIFSQTVEAKVNKTRYVIDASYTINNVHSSLRSEKRKEEKPVSWTPNAKISPHPEKWILFARKTRPWLSLLIAEKFLKFWKYLRFTIEKIISKMSKETKVAKLKGT